MAAAILLLTALAGQGSVAADERGYAVIVSKSVGIHGLTFDELHRIVTFKRTQWKSGEPINLLLPGGSLPAHRFILARFYRMSDEELRRFILQRIFQAEIDFAPKVVDVERDAVAFVASGRSMMAVVSADVPGLERVTVLRINGRLPGEAGYPLR